MSIESINHDEAPMGPRAAEQMVGGFATSLAKRNTPNPLARLKYDSYDAYYPNWQDRAACLEVNPGIFFPEKGQSTKEAKKVCRTCDVIQECGEYALANREKFGVWGGLDEQERRKIERKKQLNKR